MSREGCTCCRGIRDQLFSPPLPAPLQEIKRMVGKPKERIDENLLFPYGEKEASMGLGRPWGLMGGCWFEIRGEAVSFFRESWSDPVGR